MGISSHDLKTALADCSRAFRGVCDTGKRRQVRLSELESAWRTYYFGDFARFDRLLRESVESGGRDYESLAPISISHHNLHRLMEVLCTESGDTPLAACRVPERVHDLHEMMKHLAALLEEQRLSVARIS